ncbi:hypothetical protein [Tenacibaculum maritimum]|uniref:hypothetical protein n=1 Tax=Tenacibaculum maritimum TaxID=107401 RepID=UPI0012E6AAD7|nr:hypothetical protein [Tenacibaculum maritimum]CAA0255067.1 conserved hypothetical protein [Tenacibaculum maritimum]
MENQQLDSEENPKKTKEILIHPTLKKQVAKELNTTKQTVLTAIKYFNNSDLAVQIRKRAKELLVEEANKIQE